jgi:hypothetical protein
VSIFNSSKNIYCILLLPALKPIKLFLRINKRTDGCYVTIMRLLYVLTEKQKKKISDMSNNNIFAYCKIEHNRSLKVAVQGLEFMAHPLYINTYILQDCCFQYIRYTSWNKSYLIFILSYRHLL